LRSYVMLEMRSLKYWHPMMFFIIEAALVNSWVLYKSNREMAGLTLDYTHSQFRRSICLALASEWEDQGCSFFAPGTSPSTDMAQNKQHKSRRSLAIALNVGDRFTAEDKHVSYCEPLPLLEESKQHRKRRQMLCAFCGTHRTSQWCRKCAAALCSIKCYVYYHTRSFCQQKHDA
jgi:hypothetical protein